MRCGNGTSRRAKPEERPGPCGPGRFSVRCQDTAHAPARTQPNQRVSPSRSPHRRQRSWHACKVRSVAAAEGATDCIDTLMQGESVLDVPLQPSGEIGAYSTQRAGTGTNGDVCSTFTSPRSHASGSAKAPVGWHSTPRTLRPAHPSSASPSSQPCTSAMDHSARAWSTCLEPFHRLRHKARSGKAAPGLHAAPDAAE